MDFALPPATAALERTPRVLAALLAGLPPVWTDATEGPGTWSPRDVVAHLVHAERTNWIPRARSIVTSTTPRPFPPFTREPPPPEGAPPTLPALLDEFARLRAASLATLADWRLTAEALGREGVHPEFGRVPLGALLATWVAHDLGHVAQIVRVMARQYGDAVGPWRAYLPILTR